MCEIINDYNNTLLASTDNNIQRSVVSKPPELKQSFYQFFYLVIVVHTGDNMYLFLPYCC